MNGQTGSKLLAEHALRLAVGDDAPDPELTGLDDPAASVALDPEPPEELRPICGLYRSHNPWATTLRVATAEGRPVAIAWGEAQPLTPLAGGRVPAGRAGVEPGAAAVRPAPRGPVHAGGARDNRVPPARMKYVRSDIGGHPAHG